MWQTKYMRTAHFFCAIWKDDSPKYMTLFAAAVLGLVKGGLSLQGDSGKLGLKIVCSLHLVCRLELEGPHHLVKRAAAAVGPKDKTIFHIQVFCFCSKFK